MKTTQVSKLTSIERFHYWIEERHSVFLKKQASKPMPWTDDNILSSYYFCNPYRENDKTTVWVREHIREPLERNAGVAFAVIAFRWFNLISTGEVLTGYYPDDHGLGLLVDWNPKKVIKLLIGIQKQKVKVFTGAFNISAGGTAKPKVNHVVEDYLQPVWKNKDTIVETLLEAETLQEAFEHLQTYPGLAGSGFMAAQVIADLKHTYLLEDKPDVDTWCSLGPGGNRGLNRILGREVNAHKTKEWQSQIENVRCLTQAKLSHLPPLDAQDIQNCLCESDKYTRALFNEGHMKRRYKGV